MSGTYLLECCVDSVESAVQAKLGGADRLELCSNLIIGGTSPSLPLFHQIKKEVDIPIHALIRPRFGDFLYSDKEFAVIKEEILAFKNAGADGVAIGCLTPQGDLDLKQMSILVECAKGMSITLHRAFDMCKDPFLALNQAKELGIHTILTSGQASSCLKGIERMKELSAAAGDDIHILAGAGINAEAVKILLRETSLHHFHMSGKRVLESAMTFRNPEVYMGLPGMSEYEIWQTDANLVQEVRLLLDQA